MKLDLYQVDAFTDKTFGGNPAAVCPLEAWLPDELMQNIAAENNLSETAFFVPDGDRFHLRWFTPTAEVDLCGHATLAAAYVIFEKLNYGQEIIRFDSKSGELTVEKTANGLMMDFPAWHVEQVAEHNALITAMGKPPKAIYQGTYWVAEFETQQDVENLTPDFKALQSIEDIDFLIITAPSDQNDIDFVSRFFCPKYGIDEDPVTGSAHCILTPFWSNRLNKNSLHALQISKRMGYIHCESANDRVHLTGQATLYLQGTIYV